ncbi:hypothetical protein EDB89DRAFT_2065796 [Lactarius sanguifluus]|nr:hypothetical protein EDB89DRAFT_2065796 [Lactarius sanguifluus]
MYVFGAATTVNDTPALKIVDIGLLMGEHDTIQLAVEEDGVARKLIFHDIHDILLFQLSTTTAALMLITRDVNKLYLQV